MLDSRSNAVFLSIALVLLAACSTGEATAATAVIYSTPDSPQAQFAVGDLKTALTKRGYAVTTQPLAKIATGGEETRFVLCSLADTDTFTKLGAKVPTDLKAEGYAIRVKGATNLIVGADAAGVMYGGLEAAEGLLTQGKLSDVSCNPYMPRRGTKFNIPLDARTPSYTDVSDAAQKNIIEMWNFDFWKAYIDNLARARYNFISLWSLHPFPSLVKVPEYPDIALADVKRSKVKWKEYYSLMGIGFDAPEILGNLETLKKMSIDEKITFWRKVMAYARDRNIVFYIVTWNIFVNGTEGKYGITDKADNAKTTDYFLKSVKQLILTYPDLGGVGLTTGENMHGMNTEAKERWAFETYGRGVLDAAAEQPGRKILFIHRQHMTGAGGVLKQFEPLIKHKDIEFIFSFKYAKAHVYSCTRQPYHEKFVPDIRARNVKTMWTMRNDDNFYFRWGAPDFVREFIQNVPYDVSAGFYLGSDQYIWGREWTSLQPKSPRELEVDKHWYHWMLWGRLGYNPKVTNDTFTAILKSRYPECDAKTLFNAWQSASMVYPLTTGFHWGALDFHWYIEGCKGYASKNKRKAGMRPSTASGFHGVEDFIRFKPHDRTGYVSIQDYVQKQETPEGKKSPLDVAAEIDRQAGNALKQLEQLKAGANSELENVLQDIRTMAYMGQYYGSKIRGATYLALYRKTRKSEDQRKAVDALTKAAQHWESYTKLALSRYRNPIWMNRVGHMDWRKLAEDVQRDIEIAKEK